MTRSRFQGELPRLQPRTGADQRRPAASLSENKGENVKPARKLPETHMGGALVGHPNRTEGIQPAGSVRRGRRVEITKKEDTLSPSDASVGRDRNQGRIKPVVARDIGDAGEPGQEPGPGNATGGDRLKRQLGEGGGGKPPAYGDGAASDNGDWDRGLERITNEVIPPEMRKILDDAFKPEVRDAAIIAIAKEDKEDPILRTRVAEIADFVNRSSDPTQMLKAIDALSATTQNIVLNGLLENTWLDNLARLGDAEISVLKDCPSYIQLQILSDWGGDRQLRNLAQRPQAEREALLKLSSPMRDILTLWHDANTKPINTLKQGFAALMQRSSGEREDFYKLPSDAQRWLLERPGDAKEKLDRALPVLANCNPEQLAVFRQVDRGTQTVIVKNLTDDPQRAQRSLAVLERLSQSQLGMLQSIPDPIKGDVLEKAYFQSPGQVETMLQTLANIKFSGDEVNAWQHHGLKELRLTLLEDPDRLSQRLQMLVPLMKTEAIELRVYMATLQVSTRLWLLDNASSGHALEQMMQQIVDLPTQYRDLLFFEMAAPSQIAALKASDIAAYLRTIESGGTEQD